MMRSGGHWWKVSPVGGDVCRPWTQRLSTAGLSRRGGTAEPWEAGGSCAAAAA